MQTSSNIVFENNIVFDFMPFGIVVKTSKSITIKNNIVSRIYARDLGPTEKFTDRMAGISVCAHDFEKNDKCPDVNVIGNIVAGAAYTGYAMPGHECGKSATQTRFRDNVAHSVFEGTGAIFFPDPALSSSLTCFEASHFAAYKNNLQGAHSF